MSQPISVQDKVESTTCHNLLMNNLEFSQRLTIFRQHYINTEIT